ncbi:MAG: hypothetical protein ABIW50_03535 [Candidatus Limnocylindria bacterium]
MPGGRFSEREKSTPSAYEVWIELITIMPTPGMATVIDVGAQPPLSV